MFTPVASMVCGTDTQTLRVSRIQGKQEQDWNRKQEWEYQQKMPDDGYHVNIQVRF